MTIAFASNTPPLLACVDVLEKALDAVTETEPLFLTTAEKADGMRRLARVEARLAELRMRFIAASGEVADESGARDVAAWLAAETRQDFREPRAEQALAVALDERYGDLDPAMSRLAEKTLIDLAARHRPHELRVLGRRILEVVDPESAEAEEAKRLQAEEAHAQARTKLALKPLGDGTTRLSGVLPSDAAHRLQTYLHAFTNPRRHTADEESSTTAGAFPGSYPHQLGRAFCQLLETIDPKRLPIHAGDGTTMLVTIGLDQLRRDLGVGEVIGHDSLSATALRRLACTAMIIPVVLGGKGEVLDLGRGRRLFSPAQRKALALRDKTCRAEGCDQPASFTEAHHWGPWSNGGRTDLKDAVSLCHHDHHRVHDPTWQAERLRDGDIRFHRRT